MKMRFRAGGITLLLLIAVKTAAAVQQASTDSLRPARDSYASDFLIDPLDPENSSRQFSFPASKAVRVVVVNVNPFLFEYEVEDKYTQIAEPNLNTFFALLGTGFPTLAARAQQTAAMVVPPPLPANAWQQFMHGIDQKPPKGKQCSELNTRLLLEAQRIITSVSGDLKAIDTLLVQSNRSVVAADSSRAKNGRILRSPDATAVKVRGSALELVRELRSAITSLNTNLLAVDRTNAVVNVPMKRIAELLGTLEEDPQECPVQEPAAEHQALLTQRAAQAKEVEILAKAGADMAKLGDGISAIADLPSRFYHIKTLTQAGNPARVEIIVRRKPVDGPDSKEEVLRRNIIVGGKNVLTLGAGVMWSKIADQNFAVQKRLVDGQNEVGVIVRTGHSADRVVPMATVNARLLQALWHELDFIHFTFGTGLKTGNDFSLEYFLGGSLNAFSDKLLLSAGFYAGRSQNLPGDLSLGEVVPASFSLTKDTSHRWKFGLGLFYAVQ